MNTRINSLLDEAIATAQASRTADAPGSSKTSSAQTGIVTERQKLSSIKTRNDDAGRIGVLVSKLGEFGFHKMAMSGAGGVETVVSDSRGMSDPVATHDVNAEIVSKQTVDRGENPTIHIPSRGGGNPVVGFTGSTAGQVGTGPSEGGQMPNSMTGDSANLEEKGAEGSIPEMKTSGRRKVSRLKISSAVADELVTRTAQGMWIDGDAQSVLNRFGMEDNRDVVSFLKASADSRGMQLADFLLAAEIGDMKKTELLGNLALSKCSGGPDQYRLDLATAKEAVEAGVQTQGTLATTEEIVRTTGVDPAVANAAQMQVAQTIVAAGGSVAAPGGVNATGVGGAGAAAMAAGAGVTPMAPAIQPPMGAPAPIDPSMAAMGDPNAAAMAGGAPAPAAMPPAAPMADPNMMAAPPMADPNMMAAPPAADPTQKAASVRIDPRQGLQHVIDNWGKHSASDAVITNREEATTGALSPREGAVAPAEGATESPVGSGSYELSASERAVADAISTNQSTVSVTDADTEANKRPDIDGRVNTPVEAASAKGALTSNAPVKGTKEGTLATPSTSTGETASTKRSASDDMAAIIRRAAADSVKASSVMVAHGGRGSQEVTGGSGAATGGPSDDMSNQVKRAYAFARQTIDREGKAPDVTDVMSEAGVSLDDAKTGIYHASNG